MPTQEALQEWLQAPAPQRQVAFPETPNMSFVPTDVRANAGYDMGEMIKARDSGMSVSQFIQMSSLKNDLLKRQVQQQDETDANAFLNQAKTFDVASPDYHTKVRDALSVNPRLASNSLVNNYLQSAAPILNQQAAAAEKTAREAKSIESSNAPVIQAMGQAGFAPNEAEFMKGANGEISDIQKGYIAKGINQKDAEIKHQAARAYLPYEISSITDTLQGDKEPTTATINSAHKKLFDAQSKLGVPPSEMQKLRETPLGYIPATDTQFKQAQSVPVTDEMKIQWLTEKGIDPAKAEKRDWANAYKGVQGAFLDQIVNAPPQQEAPVAQPVAQPTAAPVSVTTQAEAMKLPSGTRFVTPEGDVFTKN